MHQLRDPLPRSPGRASLTAATGPGPSIVARVPVFVCGEPARGDDAAALAAIALLPASVRELADIVEAGQLDLLLLMDLPAGAPCVVVDAVAGIRPGEIWVRPLARLADLPRMRAQGGPAPEPRSSHELPLDHVLALAATLRDGPPEGTFIGIGGACFDVGTSLTPAVQAALPTLGATIAAEVERLAGR